MSNYFFHNGLIQFIFATMAKIILFVPVLIYTVIREVFLLSFGELFNWFHELALKEDTWGNKFIKFVGNDFLLKRDPQIKYGTNEITISKVTAINYKHEKLTQIGLFMAHTMILFNDKSFQGAKIKNIIKLKVIAIYLFLIITVWYIFFR